MDRTSIEPKHPIEEAPTFQIEGQAASDHDGLMEIISQMESRLAALRDSENQRDRLQEEIKHQFHDLDERERDLRRREAALDGSTQHVEADRATLDAERARIHESLAGVARERDSLRTREIEVGVLSETLRRDRELLEGRRAQLEAMERELRGREQVLVTQTERIDQEADELEERRKQLELREAALRELELETRAMAERQRDRENQLEEQQKELALANERYQAMQAEVISLNRRLADANGLAAEQSRKVEAARAEGQLALTEAKKQCERLETEANRVRVELAKLRRSPGSSGDPDAEPAARRRAVRAAARSPRARATILALVWLGTVGVAALACYLGISLGQPAAAAWLMGLAFAGCFVASVGFSGKGLDPAALPLVLFAGTFGEWFPRLFALVANAIETWELPLGSIPREILPQLPMAVSLLAAGLVVTLALMFLGGSGGLMVQSLCGTFAAVGLAALPDPTNAALAAGALLWTAVMAAALARWALGPGESETVESGPRSIGRVA